MKASIISIAVLASAVAAAPTAVSVSKRADIDGTILNYALTLEHLEAAFYAEGVKNFTAADFSKAGFNGPNFYKNLKEVARDETVHVNFLTKALTAAGVTPVAACTYDFGNLTADTFLQTASILEGVGVSAYLGAANLITNKDYLTAAASILTVEARHNAYIRNALKKSPFAQPFDVPLDFDQVYSLAAPFIKTCPSSNPKLPVKAFPVLTPTTPMPAKQGGKVTYTIPKGTTLPSGQLYIAFPLAVPGTQYMPVTKQSDGSLVASVPKLANGPAGQSYAILTSSNSTLTDDNTIAGPAVVNVLVPYWT